MAINLAVLADLYNNILSNKVQIVLVKYCVAVGYLLWVIDLF